MFDGGLVLSGFVYFSIVNNTFLWGKNIIGDTSDSQIYAADFFC